MLTDLVLPGSGDHYQPGRTCYKCGQQSNNKGGVQVSANRWVCVKCWRFQAVTRKG